MTPSLIEINFSEEFARRVRKAAPRKHIPTALGIVIAILLIAFALFYVYLFAREGVVERHTRALDGLKSQAAESEQLQALHDTLSRNAGVYDAWERTHAPLAPCWLRLARLAPDAVYFTTIEFERDDASAAALRMLLRGRAIGPVGETTILRFLEQLKRDACFTNIFTAITLAAVATERDEKVFAIECSGQPAPHTPP